MKLNISTKATWTVLFMVSAIAVAYISLDFRNRSGHFSIYQKSANQVSNSALSTTTAPSQPASSAQLQVTSATDPAITQLAQAVFKHIFLPSGNVQVATVNDADKLRLVNSVFYQYAKNGDKVLIYDDRAILYDPSADKVMDVIHAPAPASSQK